MATKEEWLAAMKGQPPHRITIATRRLQRGIDWRGCGKRDIADALATGRYGKTSYTPAQLRAVLEDIDRDGA